MLFSLNFRLIALLLLPSAGQLLSRVRSVTVRFRLMPLLAALTVVSQAPARCDPAPAAITQPSNRQAVEDAWWTGPLLAANADTLPPGHLYVEPYLFDVHSGHSNTPGSQSYLLYGFAPRFTAGLLPSFSIAKDAAGERHLRMGDLTLQFQYRLTKANPGKTRPSISVNVRQRLPTARYDRLAVAGAGSGNGDHATVVGLYAQQYFWMSNGRIVRARLNLSHTFENTAKVQGLSVYGTSAAFKGSVRPGDSTNLDIAAEYSLTRRFVLAGDIVRSWTAPTVIADRASGSRLRSPASAYVALAPAVEYNWTARDGIICGVRFILKGRNAGPSITPAIAYSRFF